MLSSRIFVRGLPSNLSEDQFKKHFSAQYAATDVRLMPHRRIGYVGYKTPEEAAKAVKYFNKSYIRMSRLAVEIARPIEPATSYGRTHQSTGNDKILDKEPSADAAPQKLGDERKRKRNALGDLPEKDPRLHEFLQVMKAPKKSRTWANEQAPGGEEDAGTDVLRGGEVGEIKTPRYPLAAEHESELHTKRDSAAKINAELSKEPVTARLAEENVERLKQAEQNAQEHAPPQPTGPFSDRDWLRSRTSRLLGLMDDDEDHEVPLSLAPGVLESSKHATTAESSISIDEAATDEKTTEESPPHGQSVVASLEPKTSTSRLFLRNLTYTTSEQDLRDLFSVYGELSEVHIPTASNESNRGYAFVSFVDSEMATRACGGLDGTPFQGRILHIIRAEKKVEKRLDDFALSKLPLKKQKQVNRKAGATSSSFNWNSLYMSVDAIISSVADRLQIPKAAVLDPTASDAAVKQAHAETFIIQETKKYFASHGVDLEAFSKSERGDTAILVKNLPNGTKTSEIRSLFQEYGELSRVLTPPAGMIAIVEFGQANQARAAFGNLAYRRFKDSILYLEKAPKGLFINIDRSSQEVGGSGVSVEPRLSASDVLQPAVSDASVNTSTLFVRNLNFSTTTERLTEVCKPLDGFLYALVKTKPDPKRPGQVLSMGFGFLEFRSKGQAHSAASALNDHDLDGHQLLVRAAHRSLDAGEATREEDKERKATGKKTKIIIKNLPFEVTKKDVRALFGAYGQLRSVRLPKKFDHSARGFAFAEFVTAREAESAIAALKHTHLLGRRLVLEFAADDTIDAEEELQRMQNKIGRQADKVALQRLIGTDRQKFAVEGDGN